VPICQGNKSGKNPFLEKDFLKRIGEENFVRFPGEPWETLEGGLIDVQLGQ